MYILWSLFSTYPHCCEIRETTAPQQKAPLHKKGFLVFFKLTLALFLQHPFALVMTTDLPG